jgi:hypothetical protein
MPLVIVRHEYESTIRKFASRVFLVDASEEGYKWYVKGNQAGSNCWVHVYAEPLDDVATTRSW